MKQLLKQHLTFSDILLISANLIPLWGVWFRGWDAKQIFLVYCLESVIIGVYNLLQMWLITLVKKKDEWVNGSNPSMVSGYFFMFFFLIHYGFFVFVQMTIFLGITDIKGITMGPFGTFSFVFHPQKYLSGYALWLLLSFALAYGIGIMKDFIISGAYKTASLSEQMFAPYARIFIQQFVVILGSFFILFGGGKIFILVFVVVKVFFELLINYKKIMGDAIKRKSLQQE